ncbi:MAG: LysM peptidoglycan-binding domain-containing protein [Nitrosomonas sp.]|nr:LysM peptidoglycan-binding domain-containing protein [Nitrosomonas sp.]
MKTPISIELAEQTTSYIVKDGDTLQGIAASQLNDASQWREIALANNIDNPRKIIAGVRLKIPRLK